MRLNHYCQIILFLLVVHQLNYGQTDYRYSHPLSKSLLLNLEGGTNYAFSDYEDSDLGLMFGGGIEYYFPSENKSTFGLKINLAQQYISGSNNNLGLPTNFDTEIRKLGIGVTYSYAATSVLLPFASIGGSYLWLGYDSEDVPSRFLDLSNGADKSSFILDAIIGLKYKVNQLLDINFGIGYNYVNNDNIDATVYGDYEDFFLSGQIGFSFRIWNSKDTDGDGIIDDKDQCLYQEEDFDGYQDNDGCPDLDNDSDGIPDINDGCQNIPEDLDGFQDDDGCPDPDNDGDGIDDKNDSCPDEAEVFNGYQDDDGCPDELPEPVYVEPEPVIQQPRPVVRKDTPKIATPPAPRSFLVHSETTFGGDATQIKSSAYSELDRIANELKKYPNTSWRIEGHTDKKESRSIANRITKSQADAILNYFISKGLSPANFQAVGFGDATPISSNTSVYGRMKNRRIIIRKID